MSQDVFLAVAERQVRDYAKEFDASYVRDYQNALECTECEEHLERGIKAYTTIKQIDEVLREADYAGLSPYTQAQQDAVFRLFTEWLEPCDSIKSWIAGLETRGHTPRNLREFRDVCAEVEDLVQSLEWAQLARNARLRLASQESEG